MKRARIVVTGIVQGVYYRLYAKRKADELGLSGTVRNRPDGSVEIVAEGDEKVILKLIEWSWQGPAGASVENVEAQWHDDPFNFKDFSIIH